MFCANRIFNTCKWQAIFKLKRKSSTTMRRLSVSSTHLLVDMDRQSEATDQHDGIPQVMSFQEIDTVEIKQDDITEVAVLKLTRPPVNSLNTELLAELKTTIERLENQESLRGLILTSNQQKTFCAGGDWAEYYHTNAERITQYHHALQDLWVTLAGTRLVTVAAINGHSVGAGCLLAISCDYRMMVPDRTIGFLEVQLNIPTAFWFIDTMKGIIGHRQTELCCQKGLMMTTDQAFNIGLIDEIVPQDILLEKASQEMKSWFRFNDSARISTKTFMRKDMINKLVVSRENDTECFIQIVTEDSVQRTLEKHIKQLKIKKRHK